MTTKEYLKEYDKNLSVKEYTQEEKEFLNVLFTLKNKYGIYEDRKNNTFVIPSHIIFIKEMWDEAKRTIDKFIELKQKLKKEKK